ncbi:nitrilase-related carbon-nitrogen hydrolase [Pseudomonas gessardii]|uniref:nitrilase-related carbon-nitrogen hydrolase n=1 Tax=Pseudomonas gessardii TaxID=78544 RepID=UPI001FCFDA21|nr:nitrilase-related carbon-nitrogen hydrolase [Pseudomonas gessardii]
MFKAAVVQASSIPFEPYLSAEKAAGLIREAAEKGAALVVFPEAFLGDTLRALPSAPSSAVATTPVVRTFSATWTARSPRTARSWRALARW